MWLPPPVSTQYESFHLDIPYNLASLQKERLCSASEKFSKTTCCPFPILTHAPWVICVRCIYYTRFKLEQHLYLKCFRLPPKLMGRHVRASPAIPEQWAANPRCVLCARGTWHKADPGVRGADAPTTHKSLHSIQHLCSAQVHGSWEQIWFQAFTDSITKL